MVECYEKLWVFLYVIVCLKTAGVRHMFWNQLLEMIT